METPRASSRFPVQPRYGHSTSGSESASDLRSPVFSRPTLPSRSHTRVPSSQYGIMQNAGQRRPGLAPLALGNERNRSNSESILQSTQNTKVKRMGLISKKPSDLGVVAETRSNRNSHHLRGQSHGSALRNGIQAGDSSPSDDQNGGDLQKTVVGRRLASLPEQKREAPVKDILTEISRGALYSINTFLPQISLLAAVIGDGGAKRLSIEKAFHTAIMHTGHLDQELLRVDRTLQDYRQLPEPSNRIVAHASRECAMTHERIATPLTRFSGHLATVTEPRYARTLMLTICSTNNELTNTRSGSGSGSTTNISGFAPQNTYTQRISTVSTITESSNEGDSAHASDRSATPTQHRKPDRGWNVDSTLRQPFSQPTLPTPRMETAMSQYFNGRSRSNSRARPLLSSASSSLVSTPRSGESFGGTSFVARSRSGSVNVSSEQLQAERNETTLFEKIFFVLNKSVDEGLMVIPHLQSDFYRSLDTADRQYAKPRTRNQWSALADSTTGCMEVTEELKTNLSTIRLNDRESRNIRNFWQVTKRYLDTYGDLLLAIKEAIKHDILDATIRYQLRAVHISTREAARLIATSPWNPLTFESDPQATPQAPIQPQIQPPSQSNHQHRARGSGGSATGGSPYPNNVPATPLSAALGPAAQATIPVNSSQASTFPPTPGTACLERSFEGDIFQRADTYKSLQQTIIPRRQVH